MSPHRFHRFAWFFLCYLIAVILFGAWVRISGSGNGCGNHWPTCHGEIVPQAPASKTIIEFTHRVTSGLCGIFALILIVWARRVSPRVFRVSLAVMFFVLVEAFVGAVLVKKELVAGDASVARAIVIALHLGNTLLLTASAATAAWWSTPREREARGGLPRSMIIAALVCLVITSMAGAVTALGDTIFPTRATLDSSLFAKVRDDLSAGQHFLVRLRLIHPLVAMGSATLLAVVFFWSRGAATVAKFGLLTLTLQVLIGVLNIALAAPGWMQIAHLLTAQVLWILTWLVALESE